MTLRILDFTEAQLIKGFKYLAKLRASGRKNMWLASSFMNRETDFDDEESKLIVSAWRDAVTAYETYDAATLAQKVLEAAALDAAEQRANSQ
jgi:hypothetical protein